MKALVITCPYLIKDLKTGLLSDDPYESDIHCQIHRSLHSLGWTTVEPDWPISENRISLLFSRSILNNVDLAFIEINDLPSFYSESALLIASICKRKGIPVVITIPDFNSHRSREFLSNISILYPGYCDLIIPLGESYGESYNQTLKYFIPTYHPQSDCIYEPVSYPSLFWSSPSIPRAYFSHYLGSSSKRERIYLQKMISRSFPNQLHMSRSTANQHSLIRYDQYIDSLSNSYFSICSSAYPVFNHISPFNIPSVIQSLLYSRPIKFSLKLNHYSAPVLPGRIGNSLAAGTIPIWVYRDGDILPNPISPHGPFILIPLSKATPTNLRRLLTVETYKSKIPMIKECFDKYFSPSAFWLPIFTKLGFSK